VLAVFQVGNHFHEYRMVGKGRDHYENHIGSGYGSLYIHGHIVQRPTGLDITLQEHLLLFSQALVVGCGLQRLIHDHRIAFGSNLCTKCPATVAGT
jgi:hypothetical protein